MPAEIDRFEEARSEPDPLRRAKLVGELITLYQQRGVELARLRKEAINAAASERGVSFTAIADELGLTRGRVSQIRSSAPPAERAFYGVGPVTVAVPLRAIPDRKLPVLSSEDARAYDLLARQLTDLAFVVNRFGIPTDGRWQLPDDDVIAICGPKSSPITVQALESDPVLTFAPDDDGHWVIRDQETGDVYTSEVDQVDSDGTRDTAYLGRLAVGSRTVLIVAGIHALGSVGVIDYLARNLPELYAQVGTKRFSMVISSQHDGDTVTRSRALCPPRLHE